MRTITQTLNMTPGGVPPVIHVSQYDSDFTITFTLFSLFGGFTIESGTTALIRGTKSSGTGYSADAAIDISAKTVTVTGNAQMTAAAGQNIFEIVLKKNNKEISSKNFILHVERAALDADTITDESVLRELNAIIEGAETATQAAEDANDAADRAEAAAQTFVIDSTLTRSGQAADAKIVGDKIDDLNKDLNAEIVYSDIKLPNRRYVNTYLIPDTGRMQSNRPDSFVLRYIGFSNRVRIELDNPDYVFVVWAYSAYSQSAGVYSPSGTYSSESVVLTPKNGAVFFAIGVMRSDGANLTTDYSDTQSDVYKIVNSIKTYEIGTDDVTQNNAPAYMKAVRKEISILFIGNSLTHDAVSYVPYILRTLFPNVNFKIHMYFNGGKTLATQYTSFVNEVPAANYSICDNGISWTTNSNQYTMKYVLETYKFDVICMQDYFTFRSTFTDADLAGWNNCQSYIEENYKGGNSLRFVTLMPAPVRDNWTSQSHPSTKVVYSATETAMKLMVKNTCAEDIIPCGAGIYKAMDTSLDELGDMGHLSHDGLHAQEGIPCLLQAYIVTLWIVGKIGIPNSVIASPIRITTEIFNSLNVPGQNVGTGVIEGTDAENTLAQEIAVQAFKEGKKFITETQVPQDSNNKIYDKDVIASSFNVRTYDDTRVLLTPSHSATGYLWDTSNGAEVANADGAYARYDGIGIYSTLYIDGTSAGANYRLYAFYSADGTRLSVQSGSGDTGAVGASVNVPDGASYVIVNSKNRTGDTARNIPIKCSALVGDVITTSMTRLSGTITNGYAWRSDKTTIENSAYRYERYDNLPDSEYIYVSGQSYRTYAPFISFYDSSGTLISTFGAEGTTAYQDCEITIPNGTSYFVVNNQASRASDYRTVVYPEMTTQQDVNDEVSEKIEVLEGWITPEKYGAIGDGVTDDSNAFALALNDGRSILLGRKTYKANINIARSNVVICGYGTESIIKPADITKPIIKINVDTAETTAEIVAHIKLKDFKIYGGGDVIGISMRCCQYCFFERLRLERCYVEGIRIRGVFDSRINDCALDTCGNHGFSGDDDGLGNYAITIDAITGMNTNAIAFLGMRIEQTPRMLKLQNTQQLMFTDCKFETHTTAFSSDETLAPIKAVGTVKGIIFTNCILAYSGMLTDTETRLLAYGNPLIYTQLNDIMTTDESYILFSACQFRSQKTCRYFSGNYIHFVGCTFNRCTGTTEGNILKKHSSLIDCNMAFTDGVRALSIEGEQVIVDNVRINVDEEDSTTSVINVDSTATRGKVSVLYNGNDRNNLVDGTIGIPVEFIGLRSFPAT